ncbi:MAG: DEAD/DEAH box helicase [Nanoarchaeota archaeon]
MEKFKKLGISGDLLRAIQDSKYTEPSEIQEKAIPYVVAGRDVVGSAATGSGKTLAFGAAIVDRIAHTEKIQALIMAPTRELAEQVAQSLKKYARYKKLNIATIYGGVDIKPQMRDLRYADVVVGTPGRLLDHLQRGTIDLKHVKVLILDEADRMLDMGFIEDVETIIKNCPKERQTLLFSATLSQDVKHLSRKYLRDAVDVSVESYVDASKLTQVYYDVPKQGKFSLLVHLLKQERAGLVMVFCNTRRNADFVAKNLYKMQIDAMALHGGLTQNKRNRIMEKFKSGQAVILVCTDVAARGLDIKNVSHVYNYDIPKNPKEYVHRIGRTARAGKDGIAVNVVSERDYDNFRRILLDDELKIDKVELPEFESIMIRFDDRGDREGRGGFGGRGGGRYRDRGQQESRGSGDYKPRWRHDRGRR